MKALSSALSFLVVEGVFCPLHGLGKVAAGTLAAMIPGLAPAQLHAGLVNLVYQALTWVYGTPPVPSLRFFTLRATALDLVHQAGVTLAVGCVLAPLVKLWAARRYAAGS